MDRIKELLGRIQDLNDVELQELRTLILRALDDSQADPSTVHGSETYERLEFLASAATQVKREEKRREDNVLRAHDATQVLAFFRTEPRRTGIPVVPADRLPRRITTGSGRALTASGADMHDSDGLSREFADVPRREQGVPGVDGEKIRVATLRVDRGPSRTLHASDSAEKITASVAASAEAYEQMLRQVLSEPQAMTAAGGFGATRDTDYDLPGFEVSTRLVKGAPPTFTADRGGVRLTRPPQSAGLNGAVGIWTVQNDIDARTNPALRKPALRVLPGGEVAVDTEAITNLLVFGNLLARAYPEFVQRVTDLALAAHARIAEQQLLTEHRRQGEVPGV
jgi:hypothetical protein